MSQRLLAHFAASAVSYTVVSVKQVLFIFGTRPEAIKLCPVIRHMRASPARTVRVCVTAQHRAMLDQVLEPSKSRPITIST